MQVAKSEDPQSPSNAVYPAQGLSLSPTLGDERGAAAVCRLGCCWRFAATPAGTFKSWDVVLYLCDCGAQCTVVIMVEIEEWQPLFIERLLCAAQDILLAGHTICWSRK